MKDITKIEKDLYKMAYEFASKGIDIEKIIGVIEGIMSCEAIQKLMKLTQKNYYYLYKMSGLQGSDKNE